MHPQFFLHLTLLILYGLMLFPHVLRFKPSLCSWGRRVFLILSLIASAGYLSYHFLFRYELDLLPFLTLRDHLPTTLLSLLSLGLLSLEYPSLKKKTAKTITGTVISILTLVLLAYGMQGGFLASSQHNPWPESDRGETTRMEVSSFEIHHAIPYIYEEVYHRATITFTKPDGTSVTRHFWPIKLRTHREDDPYLMASWQDSNEQSFLRGAYHPHLYMNHREFLIIRGEESERVVYNNDLQDALNRFMAGEETQGLPMAIGKGIVSAARYVYWITYRYNIPFFLLFLFLSISTLRTVILCGNSSFHLIKRLLKQPPPNRHMNLAREYCEDAGRSLFWTLLLLWIYLLIMVWT